MNRIIALLAASCLCVHAFAQDGLQDVPRSWKWLDNNEAAFSRDGSFTEAFAVNVKTLKVREGVYAPEKYIDFPVKPEGAVNLTYSPDSTMLAFTRDNDLYVVNIADGVEKRFTSDGSDVILNGWSSWVYYEEILGRPTKYRAFWWSPDSRKLAFYRYDDTDVPMFPIYSGKGQDGVLRETHYPKVGEANPKVMIGIADVASGDIVWADFDPEEDGYFGTPFWGPDSRELFVQREPRIQNTLDVYSVSVADGSKKHIYHETYKTWLDFISGMIFTDKGLYAVRSFETGWEQIYFMPYDGSPVRRLTDGQNWRVNLVRLDEKNGDVYFTAERDCRVRTALYKVSQKGVVTALTDPAYTVSGVSFSPDGKHFVASVSNYDTPNQIWLYSNGKKGSKALYKVADHAAEDFDVASFPRPRHLEIRSRDGLPMYGYMILPEDFDPAKKYPVHVDIYGGPDSPQVQERWRDPRTYSWWGENGIIQVSVDNRAAGFNGREGLDYIYRCLDRYEVQDFVDWAEYLQGLPFVDGEKIGVEGYSFGGTMTAMLLFNESEYFHYGIGSSGVYDWTLYDSHYTERFMETPATNAEGFASTRVISSAKNYPVDYGTYAPGEIEPVMLKLTHGTGDDNVHFQGSLQLVDELLKEGKKFEFMMYPDGMHGYRGYQQEHFVEANRDFWLKYLVRKQ